MLRNNKSVFKICIFERLIRQLHDNHQNSVRTKVPCFLSAIQNGTGARKREVLVVEGDLIIIFFSLKKRCSSKRFFNEKLFYQKGFLQKRFLKEINSNYFVGLWLFFHFSVLLLLEMFLVRFLRCSARDTSAIARIDRKGDEWNGNERSDTNLRMLSRIHQHVCVGDYRYIRERILKSDVFM